MDYLTSVSVAKQENNYIEDFYQIHKRLGVEKFLFFDREQDNLSRNFRGYDDVEVLYYPEPGRHHHAWAEGVKHLKGKTVWAQFIDIDQVVVPGNNLDNGDKYESIPEMLQDYEHCGALALNWHSFGSSHLEIPFRQTGHCSGELDSYLLYINRAKSDKWINNHIQSIVQVDKAQTCPWGTPHNAPMLPGYNVHNAKGQITGGYLSSPPTHDAGFVAHYYTRSREEWNNKMAKGRADTGTTHMLDPHWAEAYKKEGIETAGDLFDVHNSYMNEVEDLTVSKIWKSIK